MLGLGELNPQTTVHEQAEPAMEFFSCIVCHSDKILRAKCTNLLCERKQTICTDCAAAVGLKATVRPPWESKLRNYIIEVDVKLFPEGKIRPLSSAKLCGDQNCSGILTKDDILDDILVGLTMQVGEALK